MPPRIPIETSARHIHITKEDFEALFGEGKELTFVKELSQPGQYVAAEKLAVVGPRGEFEKVSILGPFRKDTQIELSMTDTRKIGVPGVIRQSGDMGFDIAKKCTDTAFSERAIACAKAIMKSDSSLSLPEHALLLERVNEIYREKANTIN